MASFSQVIAIINKNKLTGSNYVDWKRNLDIVLTAEEHKFMLYEPCPNFPSLDAPHEEKQHYDHWKKSNEIAKFYILASISNVLQYQMQDVELASDIMLTLKEMFGDKGMKSSFLFKIYLVQNPTNSRCVDLGCINHIYNSLQGF